MVRLTGTPLLLRRLTHELESVLKLFSAFRMGWGGGGGVEPPSLWIGLKLAFFPGQAYMNMCPLRLLSYTFIMFTLITVQGIVQFQWLADDPATVTKERISSRYILLHGTRYVTDQLINNS